MISEKQYLTPSTSSPLKSLSATLRFCKSESSESLGAGGTHPAVGALRQHAAHSRSSSGLARRSASVADPSPSQKPTQTQTESRSQKHNRVSDNQTKENSYIFCRYLGKCLG